MSNFAKNGRVSPLLAKAVDILGIRIVGRASAEGELEPMHKCRGEKTALQKLVNGMLEEGYAGGRIRIRHSENPTMAVRLVEELRKAFPNADITVGANRGLCSYYAERGGILVGFEIK